MFNKRCGFFFKQNITYSPLHTPTIPFLASEKPKIHNFSRRVEIKMFVKPRKTNARFVAHFHDQMEITITQHYFVSHNKATPRKIQWSGCCEVLRFKQKMYVKSVRLGFL